MQRSGDIITEKGGATAGAGWKHNVAGLLVIGLSITLLFLLISWLCSTAPLPVASDGNPVVGHRGGSLQWPA